MHERVSWHEINWIQLVDVAVIAGAHDILAGGEGYFEQGAWATSVRAESAHEALEAARREFLA